MSSQSEGWRLTWQYGLIFPSDLFLHALRKSLEHHLDQMARWERHCGSSRTHDAAQPVHAHLVHNGHGLQTKQYA